MRTAAELVMAAGAVIALLAGIGLIRFSTPFARIQVAGKASPVALLLTAVGAAPLLGWPGAVYLMIVAAAMIVPLPVIAHLLLRVVHRTSSIDHLVIDDLAADERRAAHADADDLAADEESAADTEALDDLAADEESAAHADAADDLAVDEQSAADAEALDAPPLEDER